MLFRSLTFIFIVFKLVPVVATGAARLTGDNMNREQWLAAFATAARPHINRSLSSFDEEAAIRLSCGFAPITNRKRSNAAVVPPTSSEDFTAEIFISPTVDDAAIVARHIIPLLAIAQAGNWRNQAPSVAAPLAELPIWAGSILANLGDYPHARLNITTAPKQTTRLIKVLCAADGYIARVSRTTIITLGTPICPACRNSLVVA